MLENWIPEKVPLSKLLKNENNPRTITKAKLQKLIESLQGVGIFKPIICTWDYKIIGGTQRNIAILELMPSSFEVYIMRPPRPLSQEDYDKVLLLDNAHSGQWDMDALANNYSLEMIEDVDIGVKIPEPINPSEVDLPNLGDGSDPDIQQVTFTLSNEQKDILDEAMDKAKKEEDCTDEINQNKNGNILAAILRAYVRC